MNMWQKTIITEQESILDAINKLDSNEFKIILVINSEKQLIGTITDGDVRRGILAGTSTSQPAFHIMNKSPKTAQQGKSLSSITTILKENDIRYLPILNTNKEVVNIESLDRPVATDRENAVVLMAGGLGTRLRPFTNVTPKPLLDVGGKPILETILHCFKDHGFKNFFISVNYKADQIIEYFDSGKKLGIDIKYLNEKKKLGTAGALGLLPKKPQSPIIVMNGDILTKVNYDSLLRFHELQQAAITVCIIEHLVQVPYGVIELENENIKSIHEKPVHNFFVSAGIYVLNPEVFKFIDKDNYLDMPMLIKKLLDNNDKVAAFPIREYWTDIGQMSDFKKAQTDFDGVFGS